MEYVLLASMADCKVEDKKICSSHDDIPMHPIAKNLASDARNLGHHKQHVVTYMFSATTRRDCQNPFGMI